ncbi:MAG: hypothetical protein D6723_08180 [Acidobacteria bacterium]|nr:MAG: hypothetical protein D6723_08180 [Acidobacteriota bacterium]
MTLSDVDIAIIVLYLLGVVALGSSFRRRQRDVRDYFLGRRDLPWWAIMGSIVATETSTLTFIGVPALAFATNFAFIQLVLGYLVGRLIVVLVLIPSYFRGQLLTAYQLLRHRFGLVAERSASALFLVTRTLADGVRLFATALVLVVMLNLNEFEAIIIIAAATVVYCYLGGMRAIIWTDVVQLLIYLAGALVAATILIDDVPGGWAEILRLGHEHGKWQWVNWRFDLTETYTFWSGLVGGAFFTTATHGTDQLMVQRYLCARSRRQATLALLFSGVVIAIQFLLFLTIGVMLFAYYTHFPPPQPFDQPDKVFPHFLVTALPPGIRGVVIAGVFAAAMSTLSSSLNSLAASSVEDFYRPLRGDKPESHYLRVARGVTILWALVELVVAWLARRVPSVLEAGLAIAGFTNGSMLGLFLLGVLAPGIGQTAGLIGMAIGLGVMLIVAHTSVAWPWYVLVGSVVTFVTGLAAHWIVSLRE